MTAVPFVAPPDVIDRPDLVVMGRVGQDEIEAVQQLWPAFEQAVGLRGRKMYGCVDTVAHTYRVCTPVLDGDDPAALDLEVTTIPGGGYLRGRLGGEPPELYEQIGPGMAILESMVTVDPARPLVEYYRRHDRIELWVPWTKEADRGTVEPSSGSSLPPRY